MNKTQATQIARHLHSSVERTAAGNGVTYGYIVACGPNEKRKIDCGEYRNAQTSRRESIQSMTDDLMSGDAPEWATLEFNW